MKVAVKQPVDLEAVLASLVKLEVKSNKVTVTKEGTSIATLDINDVKKGNKGSKGKRGLYPYELAGFKTQAAFDLAWSGDHGPRGAKGFQGYVGDEGEPAQPSSNVVKLVTDIDAPPSLTVAEDNTLVLTIPVFEELYAQPFWKFIVNSMTVTKGDKFKSRITWETWHESGALNITLPIDSAVIKTGNVNQEITNEINDVTVTARDTKIPGFFWSCTKTTDQNDTTYTFLLSSAAKGSKGPAGDRGRISMVTSTLIGYEEDSVPSGFGAFSFDEKGFVFSLNNDNINFVFQNQDNVWSKEVSIP